MNASTMMKMATLALFAACGNPKAEAAPAAPGTPSAATVREQITQVGGITDDEIRQYPLSMEKVEAWHRAELDATRAFVKNPSLKPAKDSDSEATPDDILHTVEANATVRSALRAQGLEPREAVTLMTAMVHAGIYSIQPEGAALPAEANAQNVRFVREHRAELDRMRAEIRALEEQIPDAS